MTEYSLALRTAQPALFWSRFRFRNAGIVASPALLEREE